MNEPGDLRCATRLPGCVGEMIWVVVAYNAYTHGDDNGQESR